VDHHEVIQTAFHYMFEAGC